MVPLSIKRCQLVLKQMFFLKKHVFLFKKNEIKHVFKEFFSTVIFLFLSSCSSVFVLVHAKNDFLRLFLLTALNTQFLLGSTP